MTAALTPYWRTRWRQSGISLLIGGGRVAITVGALAYAGSQASGGDLTLDASIDGRRIRLRGPDPFALARLAAAELAARHAV